MSPGAGRPCSPLPGATSQWAPITQSPDLVLPPQPETSSAGSAPAGMEQGSGHSPDCRDSLPGPNSGLGLQAWAETVRQPFSRSCSPAGGGAQGCSSGQDLPTRGPRRAPGRPASGRSRRELSAVPSRSRLHRECRRLGMRGGCSPPPGPSQGHLQPWAWPQPSATRSWLLMWPWA